MKKLFLLIASFFMMTGATWAAQNATQQTLLDYEPYNLQVEAWSGHFIVSWYALNSADKYLVQLYSEDDELLIDAQVTEKFLHNEYTDTEKDLEIAYWTVTPYDNADLPLSEPVKGGSFTALHRTYSTSNLTATPSGLSCTFAWQSTGVDHWVVEVYDKATHTLSKTEASSTQSCTIDIITAGEYVWLLKCYDNKSHLLEDIDGPEFTIAKQYVVDIKSEDAAKGTVTVNGKTGNVLANYEEGATLNIKANPLSGYQFNEWSDGNKEASRTVTVNADIDLTARFKPEEFKLTVATIGEGTVNYKEQSFPYGTKITLKATPKSGNEFICWSSKTAVGKDNYEEASVDIEMTKDFTLAAIFADVDEDERATLRMKIGEDMGDMGKVKADLIVEIDEKNVYIPLEKTTVLPKLEDGVRVRITATANEGFQFVNWNNNEEYDNPTRNITVRKTINWTAYFEKMEEGIEDVDVDANVNVNKRIENGMLIITRDGKDYTITGQRL